MNNVEGEIKDDEQSHRLGHDLLEDIILEDIILEGQTELESLELESLELESLSGVDLETAAVLSYAAPTRVPAADLKARLFDRLARLTSQLESRPEADPDISSEVSPDLRPDLSPDLRPDLRPEASPQKTEGSALFELLLQPIETLKQAPEPLPWKPVVGAPGFEMATWKIDRAYNYIALFIRAKTKASFPLHHHSQEEALLVLAGDLTVEEKVYGVGDRIHSQATSCHALETQTGCLVLVIASGQDLQQP